MKSTAFSSNLATMLAGTATAAAPVPMLFGAADGERPSGSHGSGLPEAEPPLNRPRPTKGLLRRYWPLLVVLIATAARLGLDAAEARAAAPAAVGGGTPPAVEVRNSGCRSELQFAIFRFLRRRRRPRGATVFDNFM